MIRRSLAAALVAAALSACGGTELPPAASTSGAITGRGGYTHWFADGTSADEDVDFSRVFVQAHVPQDSGYQLVEGSTTIHGGFSVPIAPPKDGYWLRVFDAQAMDADGNRQWDRYFWTDSAAFDLSQDILGHASKTAGDGTTLAVDLDALSPWQDGDQISIASVGAAFLGTDISTYASNPPQVDATSAHGMTMPWTGRPLFEGNDVAVFTQTRLVQGGQWGTYRIAVKTGTVKLAMTDGQATSVHVELADVPTQSAAVDVRRDRFAALQTKMNPTLVGGSSPQGWFDIDTRLGGTSHGLLTMYANGFVDGAPRDQSLVEGAYGFMTGGTDVSIALPWSTPYPSGWTHTRYQLELDARMPAPEHRDVSTLYQLFVGADVPGVPGTLAPGVSPVESPTIDGRDAFEDQDGVGLTPVVAWQPPASGTPTSYDIRLLEIQAQISAEIRGFPWAAYVYDEATLIVPGDVHSIRLPANVLHKGATYALRIRAIAEPGQDVRKAPLHHSLPSAWADLVTSYFTP